MLLWGLVVLLLLRRRRRLVVVRRHGRHDGRLTDRCSGLHGRAGHPVLLVLRVLLLLVLRQHLLLLVLGRVVLVIATRTASRSHTRVVWLR